MSPDKPDRGVKKQTSQSVSTGSDSEGADSDKPLLHFKEKDVAVSYKPGRKKKQAKKVELSPFYPELSFFKSRERESL